MKKIIAAFDGLKFSRGTMEHTIYLAKHYSAFVAGVFLDDFTYTGYGYADLLKDAAGDATMRELDEADKRKRDAAAKTFGDGCQEAGLNYSIHRDKDIALAELLHESIYADLLVIDSSECFTRTEKEKPSPFIRDLLSDVQCPVLLVQPKFKPI
jgi:hypothetical protein